MRLPIARYPPGVPKPNKRSALEVLSKKRLVALDRGFEVGTAQSESKETFLGGLAGSKRASFEKLLAVLSKGELQDICAAHELPTAGNKDALSERILGRVTASASKTKIPAATKLHEPEPTARAEARQFDGFSETPAFCGPSLIVSGGTSSRPTTAR